MREGRSGTPAHTRAHSDVQLCEEAPELCWKDGSLAACSARAAVHTALISREGGGEERCALCTVQRAVGVCTDRLHAELKGELPEQKMYVNDPWRFVSSTPLRRRPAGRAAVVTARRCTSGAAQRER